MTAGQNNAISKFVDQSFDEAYNQTVTAGDLPHVRWGRVDYINVTYLTTKWAIWSYVSISFICWCVETNACLQRTVSGHYHRQGPDTPVLQGGPRARHGRPPARPPHRGALAQHPAMEDELRARRKAVRIPRSRPRALNTISDHAPLRTHREWILHYYAFGLMHAFNFVNRFPRWMLMIGSGMIASLVMRLLHKSPAEPTKPANPTVAAEDSTALATSKSAASSTTAASTATSSPSKSSKGSAKSRKGKK